MVKFIAFVAIVASIKIISASNIPCAYRKRGCYAHVNRFLPDRLLNRRLNIDWSRFERFVDQFACECAALAKAKGYALFGIRFYGECYGGNKVKEFDDYIKSSSKAVASKDHCVSHTFGECSDPSHKCVGTHKGEYIYEVVSRDAQVVLQHGGFGPWEDWGECTTKCGDGIMTRERQCNNPIPRGENARDCRELGAYTEEKKCQAKECPINGGYTEWASWSKCTRSCGSGVKRRQRSCTNPSPKYGGEKCSGPNLMVTKCSVTACKEYATWGSWAKCDAVCGGGKLIRSRSFKQKQPNGDVKTGVEREGKPCNMFKCPECNFKLGDGVGGKEKNIGSFPSVKACIMGCVKYKQEKDKDVNGVTIHKKPRESGRVSKCFCESKMHRRSNSKTWKSCFISKNFFDTLKNHPVL